MKCPSVETLMQIKDVTREDALKIRAIMKGPTYAGGETRLERIDKVLNTCGVEFVGRGKNAHTSPHFYYCNAGDTYATTVLKVNGQFRVGCWGDIVERGNYE